MKGLLQAATAGTAMVAAVPFYALTESSASAQPAGPVSAPVAVSAQGRVHAPMPLRVREKANRLSQTYRRLPDGTSVPLRCSVTGQRIYGDRTWYRLATAQREYVAAHYVTVTSGTVPHC
ncbi:hypothetical protein DZF91_01070 [Actinomadura logoneensis]|uniref:SH3 domain-containing protein n=1 Tax=Actinomadura logoneensis TaxID=2293572 RepID=A0A372JTW7_9ACTN|nr:hypothetical protein [Actinomadura logoneensis]RFU43447.1 hypothetical protein DZF91_01070 [Actinomadura logoneensis]